MIKNITSFLFLLLSIIQSSKKTLSYILSVLLLWFVSAQAISFAQDPIVDPIEIEWRQLNPSKTELLNKGLSAIDLGEYKDANSSIKPNVSMDGGGFNYRSQSNGSLITLSPQYSKQTGFSIGGVFAKSITDNAAIGVIFNAGADRNEWLVNAGYDINQNQRVILSLGQLRQNLEFNFQSGLEKTQVTQNNGALSYQYLLGKSWLNAAEFNAYISDTPSINLSDKTWYTDTTSLYELWNDPNVLEYVRLKSKGLQEISNHYFKRDEKIYIKIAKCRLDSEEYSLKQEQLLDKDPFLQVVNNLSKAMENGEIKGLIYSVENRNGHVMHAIPFAVAKNNGETEIIDFEGWFKEWSKISGINIRQVENYFEQEDKRAQLDHHSCTVFAIDTLKNCLSSKKFAQDVMNENGDITLDKMALGQSEEYRERLSESKKNSYIFDDRGSKHNLKAFYKGHQYAEIINKYHRNLLQEESLVVVEKIDENRLARKKSERQWETRESEINIDPTTSIKALMVKPLITNRNSLYYNDERGNKFRVVAGVYETAAQIQETFINILSKISHDKVLNKMQVMAIIEKSKEKGSLKGDEALEDIIDVSGNVIVTGEEAKKFSAAFQKECKKSGIYTGREEGIIKYVGLRLTFIPDSVVKDVGKMKIDDFESRADNEDLKNNQRLVEKKINYLQR